MRLNAEMLDGLAACLEYPRGTTPEVAQRAAAAVEDTGVGGRKLSAAVHGLADWLQCAGSGKPEERYTQLFDLKPVCTLNLGYHLYGDTYDRGTLLSGLATDLRAHKVDYEHDLPDFLPTLLRLLSRFDDAEDRLLLTHVVLIPALEKIARVLEPSPGPWPDILKSLPVMLAELVPKGEQDIPVPRRKLEVLPC